MKLFTVTLLQVIFCCAAFVSAAQTFSTRINGVVPYSSDFSPAKNGDYFLASRIKPATSFFYDIYCTRIDKRGLQVWEKIFKISYLNTETSLLGTSDNGVVIFIRDRVDSTASNYGLLIKCSSSGNVEWSKRFQVAGNLFIFPADIIENSNREYVLLYDVRADDIFATNKPQVAVFSSSGELVSQTGLGNLSFLGRGDEYYSRVLFVNEGGEYFIGGQHTFVDFDNATSSNIIRINKNGKASLLEITAGGYDSGWPIQLTEKNGKITVLGGYQIYTGAGPAGYRNLYTYATINDDAATVRTSLVNYDPFVLQKLVNDNVIRFPAYGQNYIQKNKSLVTATSTSSGYEIKKYDSAGRICPLYQLPQLITEVKTSAFEIEKLRVTAKIDTIVFLADHAVNIRDTALAAVNCSDAAVARVSSAQQAIFKNNEITLYPNPVKDYTTLTFKVANTAAVTIDLLSMQGGILFASKEVLPAGIFQRKIATAALAGGVYFIRITINGKQEVLKLVKE